VKVRKVDAARQMRYGALSLVAVILIYQFAGLYVLDRARGTIGIPLVAPGMGREDPSQVALERDIRHNNHERALCGTRSPENDWLYLRIQETGELKRVLVEDVRALLNTTFTESPHKLLVLFPFMNGSVERWPQASFTIPYYHRYRFLSFAWIRIVTLLSLFRYLSLFNISHTLALVEQPVHLGKLFNRGILGFLYKHPFSINLCLGRIIVQCWLRSLPR
jgi:hypothetical protein